MRRQHHQQAGSGLGLGPPAPSAGPPPQPLRRLVLDLRRLLHAMKSTAAGTDDASLPAHVVGDRVHLARSLLSRLEDAIEAGRAQRVRGIDAALAAAAAEPGAAGHERGMAEVERWRGRHEAERAAEDQTLAGLAAEVAEACEEAAGGKVAGGDRRDIIDELFFPGDRDGDGDGGGVGGESDSAGEVGEGDDLSLGLSDDDDGDGGGGSSRPAQGHRPDGGDASGGDPQKRQADALQSEIAEMAAHMKKATLRINATLKDQARDLDDMEDVVARNLDNVADVTDRVTDHVRSGWRRSAAQWTLLFSVAGTFIFLFMTMRVVPKRKSACLFFCEGGGGHVGGGRKQQHQDWIREDESRWQQREDEYSAPEERVCEVLPDGTRYCSEEARVDISKKNREMEMEMEREMERKRREVMHKDLHLEIAREEAELAERKEKEHFKLGQDREERAERMEKERVELAKSQQDMDEAREADKDRIELERRVKAEKARAGVLLQQAKDEARLEREHQLHAEDGIENKMEDARAREDEERAERLERERIEKERKAAEARSEEERRNLGEGQLEHEHQVQVEDGIENKMEDARAREDEERAERLERERIEKERKAAEARSEEERRRLERRRKAENARAEMLKRAKEEERKRQEEEVEGSIRKEEDKRNEADERLAAEQEL